MNSNANKNTDKVAKNQLTKEFIIELSASKKEPEWMRDYRLNSLDIFQKSKLPAWAPVETLESLDLRTLNYYIATGDSPKRDWNDVPEAIRTKYDELGIPEDEKRVLAGVGAQYESEMIYHSLKDSLANEGVYFSDMDGAVKDRPDLVQKYFGKLITPYNNKYAALNGALWGGGSFIYIPHGVYVDQPLHNFFQMGKPSQGQFERTIIVAEDESYMEFVEGCVAPIYSTTSIHAGVVEIFVGKEAEVKFTTLQNWSKNVWNLVTKKARVDVGGSVDWLDGNVGSGITMKYPCVELHGKGSKCRISSLVFAGNGQLIDAGAKVFHLGEDTQSVVESKSILRGGQSIFRGKVYVDEKANNSKSSINCVSLMMEGGGHSYTRPDIKCKNSSSVIDHESSILKFTKEQLAYLQNRSFTEKEARSLLIGGFVEPFVSKLPLEYAVEFNRLIELEIEDGAVG